MLISVLYIFPNYLEKIYYSTMKQIYEKERIVEQPVNLEWFKTSDKPVFLSRNHQNMILTSYYIFKENIFLGVVSKHLERNVKKENIN